MSHRAEIRRLLLFAACVAASSCLLSGPIADLNNAADCNTICNRYKDCVDGQQDLVGCVERCQHKSSDDHYMSEVGDCESCIDSNTCDIMTKCAPRCAAVLP